MTWQKLEFLELIDRGGQSGLCDSSIVFGRKRRCFLRTALALLKSGHVSRSMTGIYWLTDSGRAVLNRRYAAKGAPR